jgi:hypothetical protein
MDDDPNNEISFHDVLHNSYNPKADAFQKHGYDYDSELSNHNQQVYYNPSKKKMIYSVAGTHNISDVGTDFYLGIGKLKDTNRYKEADDTLRKAKQKYQPTDVSIGGHSLGGAIAGYIADKDKDKVFTLNKGATIGQSIGSNENAFRTKGDQISLFNSWNRGVKTLKPKNKDTGIALYDALKNHSIDNIHDKPIYI